MLPAFNIGIFFENFLIRFSSFLENPVVPITTLLFNFEAILRISKVHLGIVKSIITSVFLNASSVLNSGKIPLIFLLMTRFSVRVTRLKFLFLVLDFISCRPILPIQPVMPKLIFFINENINLF